MKLKKLLKMDRNLLVTLADENYLDGARQVFSSAYFKGGWKYDMMLLSYNVPRSKLKWFKDNNIIIKKCKPIFKEVIGTSMRGPVNLAKFYLFKKEFKAWNRVVFLDADVIVRHSLQGLLNISGFGAVKDSSFLKIKHQFSVPCQISSRNEQEAINLYNRLKKDYDVEKRSFNSGVFVINTNIIEEGTLDNLISLFKKYRKIHVFADQSTLNLFFYRKWEIISKKYNVYIPDLLSVTTNLENIDGHILHFIGELNNKPWNEFNLFYKDWKSNLEKSNNLLKFKPANRKYLFFKYIYLNKIYVHYFFYFHYHTYRKNLERVLQERFPKIYFLMKNYLSV